MQPTYVPCYGIIPFSQEEHDKISVARWSQALEAVKRWKSRISKIAYVNSSPDNLCDPQCPKIAAMWDEYDDGSGAWNLSKPIDTNGDYAFRKRGMVEIDEQRYYLAFDSFADNPEYPLANYALLLIDIKEKIDFDSLNVLSDLYSFGKELHMAAMAMSKIIKSKASR